MTDSGKTTLAAQEESKNLNIDWDGIIPIGGYWCYFFPLVFQFLPTVMQMQR